eukprot:TRINITY_DN9637_c0_g1_i3.p2 TRINITY_DN9637_c0_g1~~TRINITY_DN9637_c0_g1_i3.p2  ORF type:complete len:166 (+),score=45.80 TRINITY_DN9637_c0_g1_i3:131-628(+)
MTAECARWSARPWRRRCQSLECCRQRTGRRFAAGVPADARGRVRYEDLMRVLRGEMSEVRRQCIRAAFQKIDYNRNGALDKKDLQLFFNAAYHPKVQAGELTEAAALERLLARFDLDRNRVISWEEFEDYYNGQSVRIPDDNEFVYMMQRAWNLDHRNMNGISFH